ncbi:MAG: iduronate-2-sulfatase [Flavobacteriales bacterium]|nr:iduronate-2-sulfatase [Flavobacteriales bacterium]|tara:strand:+ start:1597 stop:3216 length:1620 start_codon:yes stop_codon:yes gene_type:complete
MFNKKNYFQSKTNQFTLYLYVFENIVNVQLFVVLFCLFSCSESQKNNKIEPELISHTREKMNVLFIIADDLNCDLGSYGNSVVKTPNIDRLAEMGVLFENAHNQYPLCGPSRASFMTGMYTNQTKITENNMNLRNSVPDVITLGQRFRQQGYQSVRIGKVFHYDNPSAIGTSGNDDIYSWDQTVNPYGRDKIEEYKINTLKPRRYGGTLSWLAADGKDEEQTDGIGASEAIKKLDDFAMNNTPFFLTVGFFRPHTPFVAPKKYFDLYDREKIEIPKISSDYLATLPEPAVKSIRAKKNQLNLEKELAQEIKEAYYSTISFVDAQVGRLLDHLKSSGLDKNTIVVFTSDHGYHMGEHGHWQKQTLFDNATRIPLIISFPNMKNKGGISKSPVELIDLYPTLMDLTGINIPEHVVGKSLEPLMKNLKASVRGSALTRWRKGYSIKTKRFRLTKWGSNGELGYELYDHKNDKKELINLARNQDYNEIMDSLKLVIEQRIIEASIKPKGLGRQFEDAKPTPKAKNITFGDIHAVNGEILYFKK